MRAFQSPAAPAISPSRNCKAAGRPIVLSNRPLAASKPCCRASRARPMLARQQGRKRRDPVCKDLELVARFAAARSQILARLPFLRVCRGGTGAARVRRWVEFCTAAMKQPHASWQIKSPRQDKCQTPEPRRAVSCGCRDESGGEFMRKNDRASHASPQYGGPWQRSSLEVDCLFTVPVIYWRSVERALGPSSISVVSQSTPPRNLLKRWAVLAQSLRDNRSPKALNFRTALG